MGFLRLRQSCGSWQKLNQQRLSEITPFVAKTHSTLQACGSFQGGTSHSCCFWNGCPWHVFFSVVLLWRMWQVLNNGGFLLWWPLFLLSRIKWLRWSSQDWGLVENCGSKNGTFYFVKCPDVLFSFYLNHYWHTVWFSRPFILTATSSHFLPSDCGKFQQAGGVE